MSDRYTHSQIEYNRARSLMPGGVNSPVRAFKSVEINPIYFKKGFGSKVIDVDDNQYIDYLGSWGPLILGHTHPKVIQAIQEQSKNGLTFGVPTMMETKMAECIINRTPSIEMVRMVNSGTEATMSALRLSRAFTGKNKVIKFDGCYHGHGDSFLMKAGSGVLTLGLPDSPGVPDQLAQHTLVAPYNDLESVKKILMEYKDEVAAVIVEPVAGNMGVIPPKAGFLQGLRSLTQQYGALLIFDEVMTGFRVGYNSAQGKYGVTPDLTTLGKVIGGGLPVGAFGGKREIMEQIAPNGPVYQAGTLSGNPLAMTAGYTTLTEMTKDAYDSLEKKGGRIEAGIRKNMDQLGIKAHLNRVGSMISLFFTSEEVTCFKEAKTSDTKKFATYFQCMLEQGVFIPPSQFEGMFVSMAHTEEDIAHTIEANRIALETTFS